ncbi:MAG: hypothetical protein RR630_08505 [Coprobacillus sp.]
MRSVVCDVEKTNECGICGAKDPLIEYKEIDGVHFIWCNKCNTITFFKELHNHEKRQLIENEMNFYHLEEKK